ncbi:hypothetical protein FQR65_LT06832 [Abscondita terminalis]|nr:hypothetical protein FQR65_LT06832 [Abscondita terminalis]
MPALPSASDKSSSTPAELPVPFAGPVYLPARTGVELDKSDAVGIAGMSVSLFPYTLVHTCKHVGAGNVFNKIISILLQFANWWRLNPAYGIKPQIHLKTKSKNKKSGKKRLDFSKRFPTKDIITQEGTVCSVQCTVTDAGFAGVCENVPWPSPAPAPVLPVCVKTA